MFYYLLQPILTYNIILIAAAVLPAILLMIKVYRSDHLEQESPALLRALVIAGVLSSLLALVEERSKYLFLSRRTWRSPEFNCQYDGVVYAVFVSLGFGLWENISYVLSYGFSTAVVRAVTAIPGHACFGVFMGIFYGVAKKLYNRGDAGGAAFVRVLSVLIPVLLHGTYDYIASAGTRSGNLYFIAFIALLFVVSYLLVSRMAKNDRYID